MIRRKPKRAVAVLLDWLNKVKKGALEISGNDNSLDSKCKDIEAKLERVKKLYGSIKLLEDKATNQFCNMEQQLYECDETFKEHKNEAVVLEKLERLETDLGKLKEVMDKVAEIDTSKLDKMLNKPEQSADPTPTENKENEAMSKGWKDINLEIEEKISESEAMSTLLASFRNLESFQEKMCSMFLSVFPETSVIMKKPVIYWWIGEGIVTKKGAETAEEVGEKVFQQLLNQGFIKPSSEDNSAITVKSFTVHPWIRQMLILAAKENKFLEFSRDGSGTPLNGLRRAFSCGRDQNADDNLLTVFNLEEKYLGIKSDWLLKLKKVEVLQLGRWRNNPKYHIEIEKQDELLKGLGPQKHLKYLSLRGISLIETLQDSIANLFSLEILDLRACHNLDRLPPAVAALTNLTHLDVSECYLLESMPKGLEYLRSLQVLKGFVIGKEWKNSCRIGDLSGRLRMLRKLSIRVGSNDEGALRQLSELDGFTALLIRTISWGVEISSKQIAMYSFPQSLTKLHILCAPKWGSPSSLPNLEKLYITGGTFTSLPEEQGLKTVKFLRFKYLRSFRVAEQDLKSVFPKYLRCEIIERDDGQSRTFINNGY